MGSAEGAKRRRKLPGYRWRVLAHPDKGVDRVERSFDGTENVCFDELVVDDWFHMEQMDTRDWWIGLAGLMINVHIPAKGQPEVLIEEDDPARHGRLRVFVKAERDSREASSSSASCPSPGAERGTGT